MKTAFLCALVAVAAFALGGCALMSSEDRDFYGRGWVHPGDLDDDAPLHAKPARTSTAGGPAAATAPAANTGGGGATLEEVDAGAPFLTPEPSR